VFFESCRVAGESSLVTGKAHREFLCEQTKTFSELTITEHDSWKLFNVATISHRTTSKSVSKRTNTDDQLHSSLHSTVGLFY